MASIAQALLLLGVPLPTLHAATAKADLQAWKDGTLRDAWRALAKSHHPDRAGEGEREAATRRFAELSDAHDQLRALDVTVTAATEATSAEATVDDGRPKSYTDARGRVHTTYTDSQGRSHTRVSSGVGAGRPVYRPGYSLGATDFVQAVARAVEEPAAAQRPGFTPVGQGGGRTYF